MIKRGEVDWTKIFAGSKHFHVSGITPALVASASAAEKGDGVKPLKRQKRQVVTVSYDLNYRKKLFTIPSRYEKKICRKRIMADVDILVTTGDLGNYYHPVGLYEEWVIAAMNGIRDGSHVFSDEAYEKFRDFTFAVAQLVVQETWEEETEREHTENLINIPAFLGA